MSQSTTVNPRRMEVLEGLALQGCGGFIQEQKSGKPDCPLISENGNIFNLMGIAARTLRKCGRQEQAEEMWERIMGGECHDYYAALYVIGEYVNITEKPEQDIEMEGGMTLE